MTLIHLIYFYYLNDQTHLSQSVIAREHMNQSKGCSGQHGFTLLHVSMQLFREISAITYWKSFVQQILKCFFFFDSYGYLLWQTHRQASRAMVSPFSRSSRQIEHSPLSLASTSAIGQDMIELISNILANEKKQKTIIKTNGKLTVIRERWRSQTT